MGSLLAIDTGLRTGMAVYGRDGRLTSYRSQHFGTRAQLRRWVAATLQGLPDLEWIVLEGGGPLADVWANPAAARGLQISHVIAERWRADLMLPRDQKSGVIAKEQADRLARRVIEWSGAPRPTSLRHDAAEAILVGLWGVWSAGWIPSIEEPLRGQAPR